MTDRDGDGAGNMAVDPDAHFNFGFADAWALTGNPDADEDASVTNLFYQVNGAHDHFYDLGFTEAAGNFQSDNFGAGGLGGDPVFATTYTGFDSCPYLPDFNCLNNAFFSTPPDGSIPLLLSFLFTDPPFGGRDPSFDGDVLMHEYAHGVSTRLVGVGALNGIQSGAMGEGWSDYFPTSFYNDPVMGEYSTQNALTGIRRYAYDSNPLTYGDLCTGAFGCEVHDDGEIWAATLWDFRQFYVDQLGLAAGQAAADTLVVAGLMLTPPNPSMLDARDAILQAELAGGGADQASVWAIFANRGMGCSAFSVNDMGNVGEAFDVPVAGACHSGACDSPASPLAIPDSTPNGISDTILVTNSATITDLRICFHIDHSWIGDIAASLTHIDTGTTVSLIDRPGVLTSTFGCSGSDILAILEDAATAAAEDECATAAPTIEGDFTPIEPLSAFDGEDIAGSWQLTVTDARRPFAGSLVGWSLHVTVTTITPTPQPTATPTPSPTSTPTPTPSPTATPTLTPTASLTPTPSPSPSPTVLADSDADGVPDASDNCPDWYNPTQSLPPWSIPEGDSDCDGYPDTVQVGNRASESFLGTDAATHCAATLATDDEPLPDVWPLDFDDNRVLNLGDMLKYNLPWLAVGPGLPYTQRLDLNADGAINLGDVLQFNLVFGESCTK